MTNKPTIAPMTSAIGIEPKQPEPTTPTAQDVRRVVRSPLTVKPLAEVLARIALRVAAKQKTQP